MRKLYQNTTFYLIVFIISYFIYVYPFEILNELLFNDITNRRLSLYYSLIISILVIFYFRSKNTFFLLKFFVYEGMGVGFISFWIVNFVLIFKYFLPINDYFLGIVSLILIALISFYALIYGRLIFLRSIKISSKKINRKHNFIFISDVHLGTNSTSHLKKIIKIIQAADYDFILIGGDLIDSSSYKINNFSLFNEINKPIYFVTGNHEYYISEYEVKLEQLSKFGITILDNEKNFIDDINLIGIGDKQSSEDQASKLFELVDKSKFNLLLVHKPSIWNKVKKNVDLMLSGHTHNGQIFPFNFLVRLQFKYKYGMYKNENSYLYVSSGSGCWGPRMRLGTSNEIINIELMPCQ